MQISGRFEQWLMKLYSFLFFHVATFGLPASLFAGLA